MLDIQSLMSMLGHPLPGAMEAPPEVPAGQIPGGADVPYSFGPPKGGMVNGHPTLGTQPLGSEGDPSSGLSGMAPTFDAQGNMHIQTSRDPRSMANGNQAPSFLQQLLHGSGGQSAGGAGHAGLLQSLLAGATGGLPGAQAPQSQNAGMPPWLLQLLMQMHQGQGQAPGSPTGQILPQMPQQNG